MDKLDNQLKREFDYPSYMVTAYSNFASNASLLKNTEIGAVALDTLE